MLRRLLSRAASHRAISSTHPTLMVAAPTSSSSAPDPLLGCAFGARDSAKTAGRRTDAVAAPMSPPSASPLMVAPVLPGVSAAAPPPPPTASGGRAGVMTKAKRIRLAAAAAATQQSFTTTKSPLQFAILGQQLKTLRDEEKLLSASLSRLKAERTLAQVREGYKKERESFEMGLMAREEAALNYRDNANGNYGNGAYIVDALAVNTDNANGFSGLASTHDVDDLHREMISTAVGGDLLGLAATADADAAAAMWPTTPSTAAAKRGLGGEKAAAKATVAKAKAKTKAAATTASQKQKQRHLSAKRTACQAAAKKGKKGKKGSRPVAATAAAKARPSPRKGGVKKTMKVKKALPRASAALAKSRSRTPKNAKNAKGAKGAKGAKPMAHRRQK